MGTRQAYVCLGRRLGVRGSGGQGKPVARCHLVYSWTCLTDADAERLSCWEVNLWNLPWSSEWPAQVATATLCWGWHVTSGSFSQLHWEPLNIGSVSTTTPFMVPSWAYSGSSEKQSSLNHVDGWHPSYSKTGMPKDSNLSSTALPRNHLQASLVHFNFAEEETGLKWLPIGQAVRGEPCVVSRTSVLKESLSPELLWRRWSWAS